MVVEGREIETSSRCEKIELDLFLTVHKHTKLNCIFSSIVLNYVN